MELIPEKIITSLKTLGEPTGDNPVISGSPVTTDLECAEFKCLPVTLLSELINDGFMKIYYLFTIKFV